MHTFHYGLSREIRYRSLCYMVGPCYLSILNTGVCIHWPQSPHLSLSFSLPLGNHRSDSLSVSLFLVLFCFSFIFNWRIIVLQYCCWLLPYNNMNQAQVHISPLPLNLSPHPRPVLPLLVVTEH